MLAKGQITVTNLDDGKTPFLHQAYKMKDGRFLKHYPVYEASPINGYKEGDLWHRTDGSQPGYFVANKSNTTLNLNDWTFYANELAYSDTDKFYPKFEGTYSDYNEVASDDQTKYTWKIIKADDGIGIKSVKEYYAVSTSNVTPPSLASDWSETPKATDTTNKYLWNYEVYTYSNGDTRETTKRVIGTHGTTGSTGNGITSVTNRYLATTLATGVTTATSGWTTTIQATDSVKKYLWNYEEILYTNGTKIPTTPVIIGTHGEKGDNSVTGLLTNESITLPANKDGLVSSFTGATGVFDVYDGITKKTGSGVTYSTVTQSNITVSINATTGAYSVTAMPTGTTILNGFATLSAIYNGVTIEKQLSVSKSLTGATGATGPQGATGATGSRGPTGATGTSVSSVTEYYLATSESSGIVSTDTRFTTAIQTMTATNKYLWNYEKINFSDGTSQPTIPVIIGVYGDKGQTGSTGATGRSITSITEHYLATSVSSGVTRSTSGWSTAMQPTTPTNKYLWNYETVNWSSGTTPTYVEPIIIGVHGDKGDKGDSGKDGIAGKDGKGISSTTITYGLSTTDTVEPTNYTSNVPTLVKGQYLWTKTIWKYTDNTTETGYTKTYIAKDGNNGTDGVAGKDGVGISNTKVEYVGSTSGTVTPTSGWNTAVPTVAEGNFLWTRTTWTYTDNTTETGYSVAKMGAKGATGATGSTGAPGVSSYTWIRYSPNADGSSMTPTPAANSLYIGVAITSTNSAPAAYTAYTWALIKGADGKGVKSAAITYQASTSGTVIPTGSWVTTIPTVPKGQYLWTRVVTTYTDNSTSTSYSASYQGVDGITNVTGLLTNESITLPANVGGTVTTYTGATGTFEVFEGLTKKTSPDVVYSVLNKTNIEVTIATTGVYTITSMTSGTTVLNGFATLRAIYNGVTIDKQISVTKAVTGATGATGGTGATGASATSYWITASNNIIGKSQTGVINPTTITFKGFSKTGTANSVAYSGRFIIQTSTNGTTYTTRYTSSADQNTYTYTIPSDSLFVKCLFYMAGGTTVLLDEQTVPIVESAEGMEIGGRNLIVNTESLEGYTYKTEDKFMNFNIARTTRGETGYLDTFSATTINVADGDTYTASFYARSSVPTQVACHWYSPNTTTSSKSSTGHSSNAVDGTSIVTLGTDWKRYWVTWTQSTTSEAKRLIVGRNSTTSGAVVEIAGVKLEKGNKATDWTPAPEDALMEVNKRTYNPVRYIRDWQNGSTANSGNHWYEIQAYDTSGENIALRKAVTTNGTPSSLSLITDGITTTGAYAGTGAGKNYVQVDLGAVYYDITEVKVWHYYNDGRTYKETKTEVSADGINWMPVFDSYVEGEWAATSVGNSFSNTAARTESILQSKLAKVKSEAYADGLVTVEEQARIDDVKAKLTAAKKYAEDQILADKTIKDTRNDNQTPTWYYTNHPRRTIKEFKLTSTIGVVSSEGTYGILETEIPWNDASGGPVKQTFRVNSKTFKRSGTTTSWTNWVSYDDIAETAKSIADGAASSALAANNLLTDIASDSKLTPTEKKAAKKEWDIIVGEKPKIDSSADTYGITTQKTAYNTAYSTLNTYLSSLLANLNTTSNIVGTTFRDNFRGYYNARQDLLNKIADSAKSLVDGIQIGGRNLVLNSNFATGSLAKWQNNGSVTFVNIDGRNTAYMNTSAGIYQSQILKDSGIHTFSFMAKALDSTTSANVGFLNAGTGASKSFSLTSTWQRYEFTTTVSIATSQIFHIYSSGKRYYITDIQLEKGNKATDWTPAPEDARNYKAWANSADGTADFTKIYPNENLLLESNQLITNPTYNIKTYSLADNTLTATDDVVITIKGALGADRNSFRAYNSGGTYAICTFTSLGNGIYQYKGKWNPNGGNSSLVIYQFNSTNTSSSTIEWIKLERGTTPTVYTTNPADSLTGSMPKYVGFSPLDSDKPSDYEWIINPEWTESSSMEYTSSQIEQTSKSIMTTVTESFVAEEDYTKYKTDISTQFEQTANTFGLNFKTISETVKTIDGKVDANFEEMSKYIRFEDGNIVLGSSGSNNTLRITQNEMAFMQGGVRVAYFSNQSFYINKGVLVESLEVGGHSLVKGSDGHTSFKYIG